MTDQSFNALLDAAADGIIAIDAHGIVLQINRAAQNMFGYSEEEVVGNNVSMLMPENHAHQHDKYMENYYTTSQPRIIGIGREVEGRRLDGSLFPLDLSVGECRAPTEDKIRFVGILRDLSARKHLEQMLAHERQMAARYLDSMQVLVLVLDKNLDVEVPNSHAASTLGMDGGSRINFVRNIVLPEDAERVTGIMEHLFNTEDGDAALEVWSADSLGEARLISWRFSRLATEPPTVLCSGIDNTAQHRNQLAIKNLESSIAHMDRLAMLGEMAAGIAHEINQPLAAIANFADAAVRFMSEPDVNVGAAHRAATRISEQARRAADVVTKVRQLARAETVRNEKHDLNALLTDLVALAELDARQSKVPIKLALDPAIPECELDPVQIQQVVLNLTRNAIEALTSHRQALAGVEISSAYDPAGPWIWVSVRDHGPGVDGSIIGELFEPFQTTKPSGLGLGLSICASIVRQHGGSLEYEDAEDGGAIFKFSLPVQVVSR